MNDTPKAIQELFHHLLMQRSGEERLKMGCEMFSTSRAIIRSNLADQGLSERTQGTGGFSRKNTAGLEASAGKIPRDWRLQPVPG